MSIKENLLNEFNQIDDVNEKSRFISETLDFLVIANQLRDKKIDEMFLMADENIREEKENIKKESRKTYNEIKKKIKPVKDSIMAINNTSKSLWDKVESKTAKNSMVATLNNISLHLDIVTETLIELNLWSKDEDRPELFQFEKISDKSTKKSKQEMNLISNTEIVSQQTFGLQGDNDGE